jgi:hypothetical protein
MKRHSDSESDSTCIKKLRGPETDAEFPREYWNDIINSGMGSKRFLKTVYHIYIQEFINLYDSESKEMTSEIMCKMFSLILKIENERVTKCV